jgi:hypothetical protein
MDAPTLIVGNFGYAKNAPSHRHRHRSWPVRLDGGSQVMIYVDLDAQQMKSAALPANSSR